MTPLSASRRKTRIAGLRLWRDGADLDEAEAQTQQRIGHLGVFVEARRHANRISKVEPEGADREPLVIVDRRQLWREFQHPQCQSMSVFRIERVQERPDQTLERTDHDVSSGSGRWPAISSGSGRAHCTADSGNAA
jgi:hypothetical protein